MCILKSNSTKTVVLPTGHSIKTHIENCLVVGNLTLHNVLCVPDFKYNLIYVSQLFRDLSCSVASLLI